MQKLILLTCFVVLTACSKEQAKRPTHTLPPPTERVAAVPASTEFFIQQTQKVMPTETPVMVATIIDPGPYFTPQRTSPDVSPLEFAPPEEVGDFMRVQLRGSCNLGNGQASEYLDTNNQMVYLTCQYAKDGEAAKNYISRLPEVFKAEPIQLKLQGEKSFVLLPSGNGFVYGWTQGAWYFTARSLNGRETLDSFMQNFPY